MRIKKSNRGQALIEMSMVMMVVPVICVATFFLLDVYLTKIQLINGARIGTDYVVHANPNYTTATLEGGGTGSSVDRKTWDNVREALCSPNKGTIAGGGIAPGRRLQRVTGGVPSRNDLLQDVNVWFESERYGNNVGNAISNITYFVPPSYPIFDPIGAPASSTVDPYKADPFDCVTRYRIPVSPMIEVIIGQNYIEVMGRSRVLNDTGVENKKNFSKS